MFVCEEEMFHIATSCRYVLVCEENLESPVSSCLYYSRSVYQTDWREVWNENKHYINFTFVFLPLSCNDTAVQWNKQTRKYIFTEWSFWPMITAFVVEEWGNELIIVRAGALSTGQISNVGKRAMLSKPICLWALVIILCLWVGQTYKKIS